MTSTESHIEEVEFFRFKSLVPDAKALFTNSKFDESKYDSYTSLFVCSAQYGYFVVGTLGGFTFGQTQQLRDAIDSAQKGESVEFTQCTEIKAGEVTVLSLSLDELQLYVGLKGGMFLVFDVYDIVNQKEKAQPVSSYQFNNEISMISPNPTQKDVIAVCLGSNNTCKLYQLSSSTIVTTLENVRCASWVPEGNKIICGCNDGSLVTFDQNGIKQATFPLHESVKSVFEDVNDGLYASGILWVSQYDILVIYSAETEVDHLFYFNQTQFIYLDEIQGPFVDVHPKSQYYFRLVKDFGPNIQYMVTILSASGPDITLAGKQTGGEWVKWDTADENGIPTIPLNEDGEDTFPVGAIIDLAVTKPLPPVDPSVSEVPVPPMPILMFLTTDGQVCAYHMYNNVLALENIQFQGMITSKGMAAVTKPASSKPVSASLQMNKPPTGFSFASAAKTMNNSPAFGSTSTPGGVTSGTSGFGHTGFGQSGISSFGSTNFGSAAPSAVQTVSLASLAKSAPQNPPAPNPFGTAATQNSFFQPATLGTFNSTQSTSASMNNTSMFSSGGGAKRTAAAPECNGFELGGFSKALSDDETNTSDEFEEIVSSNESEEIISYEGDEEEEYDNVAYSEPIRSNRPKPIFAKYEEIKTKPKTYERVSKDPIAKKMEDAYFDTLQVMDELRMTQDTLQDKIKFLSKTDLLTQHACCFDNTYYQWRLGDMDGIANILDETLTASTKLLEHESKTYHDLENTIDRDDQVFVTFTNILSIIEEEHDEEKALKQIAEVANQVIMTPIDLHTFNEILYKQVKEKLENLEPKLICKQPTSIPSLYALRQAIRHIDNTLNRCTNTLNQVSSKKDTIAVEYMEKQSHTLGALFEAAKNNGLIQKTLPN